VTTADETGGGTAGGTADEPTPSKDKNIRNYLEEARRLQTTHEQENPEKPAEVGLLEHDPELDDVRGLNENEREELMAIFKRKERSTIGVLKKKT
jgi:hypothetical protein